MKKQLFALALAVMVLLALSGCGEKIDPEVSSFSESAITSTTAVTEKSGETEQETLPDKTDAEESDTNNTASVASETKGSSAPTESEEKQTDKPITESSNNTQPPKTEESVTPEPTKESETTKEPESTKEPEITKEPEPTKETEQENEKTTELPPEVPETSEVEQAFDIAYWISYAKSYAQSKGLILNSEAIWCWDNPIGAGTHCIYLERDIQSRINRYAKDEDITDVLIWYESTGNNTYEIYIGYA